MPAAARSRPVATPVGAARVHLDGAGDGHQGLLVLGHGAGGGVEAPDLLAVRDAALAAGFRVARVEQPYRMAGRRAPAPAPQLDAAWTVVVARLHQDAETLVVGGRSSGARVACRTATALGAAGVVALAFPLHPPGKPDRSRLAELTGAGVPVLVVQGDRDPFGRPEEFPPDTDLRPVKGDHSLRAGAAQAAAAVAEWMTRLGALHRA